MIVKVCTDRECCNPELDLKPYRGAIAGYWSKTSLFFCIHCGQLWADTTDGRETKVLKKVMP